MNRGGYSKSDKVLGTVRYSTDSIGPDWLSRYRAIKVLGEPWRSWVSVETDFDIPTLTTAFLFTAYLPLRPEPGTSRPFCTLPLLRVHCARIRTDSKRAINTVGIFLVFGACMAALAGTTLAWPGTLLDRLWVTNRLAYMQLALIGSTVGPLFSLLSAALANAVAVWFKRCRWGWRLARSHRRAGCWDFVKFDEEDSLSSMILGILSFFVPIRKWDFRITLEHSYCRV